MRDEQLSPMLLGGGQGLLRRATQGAPVEEVCCSTVAESLPPPQPRASMTVAEAAAEAHNCRVKSAAHDY